MTAPPSTLHLGRYRLSLERPLLMGILNVTPDSFSDGGRFLSRDAALRQADALRAEGADILDIGGESTRPGAAPVSEQEEIDRVLPIVEVLAASDCPLSVDTQKPAVMRAAIAAGASMINDVNALRADGALAVCAESDVAVCLMHMQGEPRTMQAAPHYADVVAEVGVFLRQRAAACEAAGIGAERIVIDPGFGFGKSLEHNLALLAHLGDLANGPYPLLAGLSRKSMFKHLLGRDTTDRLVPSAVAAVLAAESGARLLRVHDVRESRDALNLWAAWRSAKRGRGSR